MPADVTIILVRTQWRRARRFRANHQRRLDMCLAEAKRSNDLQVDDLQDKAPRSVLISAKLSIVKGIQRRLSRPLELGLTPSVFCDTVLLTHLQEA